MLINVLRFTRPLDPLPSVC